MDVVHVDDTGDRSEVVVNRPDIETTGAACTSTRSASAPRRHARGRMNIPIAVPTTGSTQFQPVAPHTIAAMITPTEPKASASTSR